MYETRKFTIFVLARKEIFCDTCRSIQSNTKRVPRKCSLLVRFSSASHIPRRYSLLVCCPDSNYVQSSSFRSRMSCTFRPASLAVRSDENVSNSRQRNAVCRRATHATRVAPQWDGRVWGRRTLTSPRIFSPIRLSGDAGREKYVSVCQSEQGDGRIGTR